MNNADPAPAPCCDLRCQVAATVAAAALVALVVITVKALQVFGLVPAQFQWLLPSIEGTHAGWFASSILLLLAIAQFLVHRRDRRRARPATPPCRPGIISRYRLLRLRGKAQLKADSGNAALQAQVAAAFHETDKSAIRAFMTKQSIFAALLLFLLKAVSGKLPAGVPGSLAECLYVVSAGGFLAALLTVLVAIQTYSTYVRIQWDAAAGNELLKKGREMDQLSFYLLSISLLAALCAYHPWAALVAVPAFGALMLRYYFFSNPLPP